MVGRRFSWVLVAAFLMLAVPVARTAGAQDVPSTAEPGTVGERFEGNRDLAPPEAPIEVEFDDLPSPPPEAAGIAFFLENVVVSGNTVFDEAELAPIIGQYTGREIQLSELWDLRAAITVRYRNAGYILSRALVPEQEIEGGTAEIVVVEGYVERVSLQGEPTGNPAHIDSAIEAITGERPLTADTLERNMLLLNDLAGVSAVSVLRASPVIEGASELFVIWDETPYSGALSIDNFGSDEIGPAQAYATAVLSNLYGRYDSTEILGAVALEVDELQFLSIKHGVPVDTAGTRGVAFLSYTNTDADDPSALGGINISGESLRVGIGATRAVIRSRSQNLTLGGTFKLHDTETDADGGTLTRDRVRALTLSASYDLIDPLRGINLLGVDLVQGLDLLGARGGESNDPGVSRAGGETDFTKIAVRYEREQYLAPSLSLRIGARLQYSLDELLAVEEFGFGGSDIGRGFDPFALAGDHGLSGTLQLQYGQATVMEYIESFELFTFFDAGRVWRIDDDNRDERVSASSIGVGLEVNTPYDVFGSVVLAKPIDGADGDDKEAGLFFRLTKRF